MNSLESTLVVLKDLPYLYGQWWRHKIMDSPEEPALEINWGRRPPQL